MARVPGRVAEAPHHRAQVRAQAGQPETRRSVIPRALLPLFLQMILESLRDPFEPLMGILIDILAVVVAVVLVTRDAPKIVARGVSVRFNEPTQVLYKKPYDALPIELIAVVVLGVSIND